jgi:hypothetical protein
MLTAIADRAGKSFPLHAHTEGFARWKSGAVAIQTETITSVAAKVRGQRTRDVVLQEAEGRLLVSCTCPARTFELPGCKHAWATLLEADRRGALPNLRSTRTPLKIAFLEPPIATEKESEAEQDRTPKRKAKEHRTQAATAEPAAGAMAATAEAAKATTKEPAKAPKKKTEGEATSATKTDAKTEAKRTAKTFTTKPEKEPSAGVDRASRRSARETSARPEARGKPRRPLPRSSGRRR